MESEYVLETIDVPIEELEQAMEEYISQAKQLGTQHVPLYKFCVDGKTIEDAQKKLDSPQISSFLSLHSLYLSLSPPIIPPAYTSDCTVQSCTSPVRLFVYVCIPLKGDTDITKKTTPRALRAREADSSDLSTKRMLNRGIPAPKHLPITSIAYGRLGNGAVPGTNRNLIRANTSDQTNKVISYWNSKPGTTRHNLPSNGSCTRRYKKSNYIVDQLLNGKMFQLTKLASQDRKFSIDEIYAAIDKFNIVCTSMQYAPLNKDHVRKIGFNRFVYDDYGESSWFLRCVNNNLRLASEVSMRMYLKPWYAALKETYLSSRSSRYSHLSERDTENLLDAAKILYNFQRKVIDDLTDAEETIRPLTPLVWCGWLFEALDYKTSPSRLADPRSCNYFLYSFLIKRGRLPGTQVGEPESVPTFSIYEQAL